MQALFPHRLTLLALLMAAAGAQAQVFDLPDNGDTVVGAPQVVTIEAEGNSLFDLARHYGTGFMEITLANPGVNVWTPAANARVVLPTQYVLPPTPWQGVVVNIPQRRLFYFLPDKKGQPRQVYTVPLGIAREGWSTPLGETKLVAKIQDPGWTPPDSIKAEHFERDGEVLPNYVPPGEDNPMGMLALQTGFKSIFIHGTNKPWGLGTRASHGCLHLYPENAAELVKLLPRGVPIRIINAPLMAGVLDGKPVMVSYPQVDEYEQPAPDRAQAQALLDALPDAGERGNISSKRLDAVL
ncbi:L,D-transpeptidase family protein, partial [Craterilacuibacter sp.]|uniref:L,D-transpeptidase family protein n=1 Tax=Craterilacuibacter sp. TaxID=2870909 RepID=UPI003F3BF02B